MKKIVFINLGNVGSTGKIIRSIALLAEKRNYQTYFAYPRREKDNPVQKNDIIICNSFFRKLNSKLDYYFSFQNKFAFFTTVRLIRKLKKIKPDIIHLHNIHSGFVNIRILFNYIKKYNINVVWTLHDCWAFTGRCSHFVMDKCDKWKSGCYDCQYESFLYPQCRRDKTKKMWLYKKDIFSGVRNMTIVAPSKWLAGLINESYLKGYQTKVINNGINLENFYPRPSNFRQKYKIEDKIILLDVAFGWGYNGKKKGADVLIELSKILPDKYQIIMVGTDKNIERMIPNNIISIHKITSVEELAEIYTAADLFINVTREDTYPTVNMEALACGTPVITFFTGGSPEIIDNTCGLCVDVNDIISLKNKIIEYTTVKHFNSSQCLKKAQNFDEMKCFDAYIKLYDRL